MDELEKDYQTRKLQERPNSHVAQVRQRLQAVMKCATGRASAYKQAQRCLDKTTAQLKVDAIFQRIADDCTTVKLVAYSFSHSAFHQLCNYFPNKLAVFFLHIDKKELNNAKLV